MHFQSAGVGAVDGAELDPALPELLRERGLEKPDHQSRRLTQHIVRGAELVLVMERRHIEDVEWIDSAARGKVHLLGKWINAEIADPYRLDESVYRATVALVDRCITTWMERLC
jgi:protein-tyrosine phosphatase